MNIPAKALALAAILLVAATALFSEYSWAEDSCPGTTIAHSSADCLQVTYADSNQTATLKNKCKYKGTKRLGKVVAEVMVFDWLPPSPRGDETMGLIVFTRELETNKSVRISLYGEGSRIEDVRCCPSLGICQKTDCDTTDGVIDDSSHSSHCYQIQDRNGEVIKGVKEIEDGVVTMEDDE